MKQISIDIAECQTTDDFYTALLSALGAPNWHGRNLDALWNSITSDINNVVPPYSIKVLGKSGAPDEVATLLSCVQELFDEAREERKILVDLSFC